MISFSDILQQYTPKFLYEELDPLRVARIEEFWKILGKYLDYYYSKIGGITSSTTNIPSGEIDLINKYLDSNGLPTTTVTTTLNPNYYNDSDIKLSVDSPDSGIYLYQIAQLLGLDNINNLALYFDSNGNLDPSKIDIGVYKAQVENQKARVRNALTSFLTKGTLFDMQEQFSSYGGSITINPIWEILNENPFDIFTPVFDQNVFGAVISGAEAYLDSDNSLITKYGDTTFNAPSGNFYIEVTDNVYNDISSNVIIVGNFVVKDYQTSIKNYSFVLDTSGNLYYKTNDEPSTEAINPLTSANYLANTWYKFDTGISTIQVSNDFIFIKYLTGKLLVADNTLETFGLPDAKQHTINFINFSYFDDINKIAIIDVGDYFQIRDLNTFLLINKIPKPSSQISIPTIFIIQNTFNEYTVINNNNFSYVLRGITSINPTVSFVNDFALTDNPIISAYHLQDNSFIYFSSVSGTVYATTVNYNSQYTLTSLIQTSTGVNAFGMIRFFEKICILLDDNNILLYDTDKANFTTNIPLLSGTGYDKIFLANKILLYKTSDPHIIHEILGFNEGLVRILQTHRFDAYVTRTAQTFTFLPTEQAIKDLIVYLKPIHTSLNILYIIDDLGVFGWGTFGLKNFGNGEFSIYQSPEPHVQLFSTPGTFTFTPTSNITATVECWGGGDGASGDAIAGMGGGYSRKTVLLLESVPYTVVVGSGGSSGSGPSIVGGDSYFINTSTILAIGGSSSSIAVGDIIYLGGNPSGAGGGGGAGSMEDGGDSIGFDGGVGGLDGGGDGGKAFIYPNPGLSGNPYGGGAGFFYSDGGANGAKGGDGAVQISWIE